MAPLRIFYVTQEELVVWLCHRDGPEEAARFKNSDDGNRLFSSYLDSTSQLKSKMLVDVIEEEFSVDTIPALGQRDRNALINRRLARKFQRTPYRLGHFQGRKIAKGKEHDVLFSAITNDELLAPWLEIIRAHSTPLSGVYSVPLMAEQLLGKVRKKLAGNALFLSQHQGNMLRQVFFRDGKPKSARLSKSPDANSEDYGDFIFGQLVRTRRYLERTRMLSAFEEIDVYMITDASTAELILASDKGTSHARIHFIDPADAGKSIGSKKAVPVIRQEQSFISLLSRIRPRHNYAINGETSFSTLLQARQVIVGSALAATVACSLVGGINIVDALMVKRSATAIDQQIQQISVTLKRENDGFAPVRANSHEMKLAVDTGDYILQNRLPVGWVMQQIGVVLNDYPEVQIDGLSWLSVQPNDGQNKPARRRQGEKPPPVRIPELSRISAELSAQIQPFDGNMRDAFATIEKLVADLRENTAFDEVVATEYPLDPSPASALSGEVVNGTVERRSQFRLKLDFDLGRLESPDEIG